MTDPYRVPATEDTKKVYCKDCKHLNMGPKRTNPFTRSNHYDECLRGPKVEDPVLGVVHSIAKPKEKNRDFDCSDFDSSEVSIPPPPPDRIGQAVEREQRTGLSQRPPSWFLLSVILMILVGVIVALAALR